jgi:isopenicillin N synthase-like dioxygenase
MATASTLIIPTLDWAEYRSGDKTKRVKISKSLADSFKRYGFVKLVNHGFSDEYTQELFNEVSPH